MRPGIGSKRGGAFVVLDITEAAIAHSAIKALMSILRSQKTELGSSHSITITLQERLAKRLKDAGVDI